MSEEKKEHSEKKQEARKPYGPPTLTRWGTLRELTQGSGGKKAEPPGPRAPRSRA